MMANQIRIGHLIDGSGGAIQKNVCLSIAGGRIDSITTATAESVSARQGDPSVDLSFAVVVPPFVDCYAHLALSGTINSNLRRQQEDQDAKAAASLIGRHLVYLFRHGVLTVHDSDPRWASVFRERPFAGEPVSVRHFGPDQPTPLVKADGATQVKQALVLGCRGIIGGESMGRDNFKRLADLEITWVPTLFAIKMSEQRAAAMEPGKQGEKRLDKQMEQVALAREMGVRVAVGTGAGSRAVLHGEAMVEELKLLLKAGYSLSEAVCCATFNGARLLQTETGVISAGMPATFLVARGTPAQLPRKFAYLEAVYIDGMPSPFYRKNPIRGVF